MPTRHQTITTKPYRALTTEHHGRLHPQKSYPRLLRLPHNPLAHPARAACEASREARVGQPDPLASRARCGQGDRPSPHGMRETVCGISRFLKWPDRNPVLGLSRSGPVPRPELRRPRRGTRPLRALLFCLRHPTPLRGARRMARVLFRAGRLHMLGASFLFAHGDSPAGAGRRVRLLMVQPTRVSRAGRLHMCVSSFFALHLVLATPLARSRPPAHACVVVLRTFGRARPFEDDGFTHSRRFNSARKNQHQTRRAAGSTHIRAIRPAPRCGAGWRPQQRHPS